jgi:hypothetical protein
MSRARKGHYFIASTLIALAIVVAGDALAEPPLANELGARSPNVASALGAAHLNAPRNRDQAVALGTALGRGYQRLDDAALADLLAMRSQIAARANKPLCVSMWSGDSSREQAAILVRYLSPAEQRRWAEIATDAETAELRDSPSRRSAPTSEELSSALSRMLEKVPGQDGADLLRALSADPSTLAPAEQCRATRTFYSGLSRVDRPDAITIFRSSLYHDATGSD